MNRINLAGNQTVREWALTKLVGAQVDFPAGISTDSITFKSATENFHNLHITKTVQLT